MDEKKELKQEVVEETKPETNFKTVAEIYTEALKGMAVVVYHLHRSTGQNMRSIVRNVVASDILKMISDNKDVMGGMYDNFGSQVQESGNDSKPV